MSNTNADTEAFGGPRTMNRLTLNRKLLLRITASSPNLRLFRRRLLRRDGCYVGFSSLPTKNLVEDCQQLRTLHR